MTVHEVLNEIQIGLKVPKNQRNQFGKYNYRSCEDILEAVKPLLNGSIITIDDEVVLIGERYYIKATITITYDGISISKSAYAREAESQKGMSESQLTGAASSYARKYSANGLFLIDDTKDADSTNTHGKEPKAKIETLEDPYDKILPDSEKEHYLNHPALSDKQKTYLTGHNLTESLKYKIDEQIAGADAGQKEIIY